MAGFCLGLELPTRSSNSRGSWSFRCVFLSKRITASSGTPYAPVGLFCMECVEVYAYRSATPPPTDAALRAIHLWAAEGPATLRLTIAGRGQRWSVRKRGPRGGMVDAGDLKSVNPTTRPLFISQIISFFSKNIRELVSKYGYGQRVGFAHFLPTFLTAPRHGGHCGHSCWRQLAPRWY